MEKIENWNVIVLGKMEAHDNDDVFKKPIELEVSAFDLWISKFEPSNVSKNQQRIQNWEIKIMLMNFSSLP